MKEIVVVLTPGFPKDEEDSTCLTYLQNWALSVREEVQAELFIISFQYPYEEKNYTWKGFHVYAVGGQNKHGFQRLLTWLKVINKVRLLQKSYKILAIQAFWLTEAAFIGEKLARYYDIPLFTTIMGQDIKKTNLYLRLLRFQKHNFIGISKFIRQHFPYPHQTISFAIETQIQILTDIQERTIDILGVGSLIPLKRFDLFIDLIAEIKQIYPAINCKILGEGSEKEALQAKIVALDLSNNIELTGLIPYSEVLNQMTKSRILLHTSEYEGQALVFSEALACGAYLVCFPVGEFPVHEKAKIAQSQVEMLKSLLALLANTQADYRPVAFGSLTEMAKSYAKLYGLEKK